MLGHLGKLLRMIGLGSVVAKEKEEKGEKEKGLGKEKGEFDFPPGLPTYVQQDRQMAKEVDTRLTLHPL